MPDKLPQVIQLTGHVVLAQQDQGQEPPRILLMAYTGKLIEVFGWPYPLVLELEGLRFDKKTTPIIADHDPSRRIGHTIDQVVVSAGQEVQLGQQRLKGHLVAALGVVSSTMGVAQGFVADARNGFPFQVSVGAWPQRVEFLEEGQTATVNGQTINGPAYIIRQAVIRELSITVLGADNDTSATVAAQRVGAHSMSKEFEAFVARLGLEPARLSADQRHLLEKAFQAQQQQPQDGKQQEGPEEALRRQRAQAAAEARRTAQTRRWPAGCAPSCPKSWSTKTGSTHPRN